MEQLPFQASSVLNWLFVSTIYISILICLIFIIKALTKKMTLISVLMLFTVAWVFFSCANGRLSDHGTSVASMTKSGNSNMKHYKSDEWNFSLDIKYAAS